MSDKLRVGLIGLGGMANYHMELVSKIEDASITAICDVSHEALKRAGERLGLPEERQYEAFADIVGDSSVDCVLSVVPNSYHADVLALCIEHGKPVMTEKPFTVTFEEAERLKEAYDKKPIACMVGYSYRYVPAFRYAKRLLEQGELGGLRHLDVKYLQQWGAEMFDTPYSWRFSKTLSGSGALGDLGSHMIDAARWFAGEVTEVAGLLATFVPERHLPGTEERLPVDVDDFAAFTALFAGGAAGVFTTSRNAIGFGNHLEVTLHGTKGSLQIGSEYPQLLRRWSARDGAFGANVTETEVPDEFALNQLADFFDLVRGGGSADTPVFRDGYRNQKIMERIIESAATGRRLPID